MKNRNEKKQIKKPPKDLIFKWLREFHVAFTSRDVTLYVLLLYHFRRKPKRHIFILGPFLFF